MTRLALLLMCMQDQPGVGTYAVNNNATGKQILSQKKTLPSPKMGTGTRDAYKRVRVEAVETLLEKKAGSILVVYATSIKVLSLSLSLSLFPFIFLS